MPQISVIMPVYNKSRYIEETVNSILSQTYKDFELIIVDDGSTDGSEVICDRFEQIDSRVKVFHIENGGVSNARNIGIENARGEYIQFIDADDYIDTNMLNYLCKIVADCSPDIIITGIRKIYIKGSEIIKKEEIYPHISQNGFISRKEFFEGFAKHQYKTGVYGFISNKLIKKSLINKFKIRLDNSIKLAEDYYFYLSIYENMRKCYILNETFYNYIQSTENNSLNETITVDYMSQIRIQLYAKSIIQKNNPTLENIKWINCNITRYTYCYIYYNLTLDRWCSYNKILENIIINKKIMQSISYLEQPFFNKVILYLLSKKFNICIYILIKIYKSLFDICHNVKYSIIFKNK